MFQPIYYKEHISRHSQKTLLPCFRVLSVFFPHFKEPLVYIHFSLLAVRCDK